LSCGPRSASQIRVRYSKTLDDFATNDVSGDNFVHIVNSYAAIPNTLWVNDESGPSSALIEAPGGACAHDAFQSGLVNSAFQGHSHIVAAFGRATPAMTILGSHVGTREDVPLEFGHGKSA